MFLVAGGAAVENFLISISGQGYGSAWISSTLFCPEIVRAELDLPESFAPLGAIAIGVPSTTPRERTPLLVQDFLL
jgi:coenzyme F420-0:L-glutamate ligase/coenzyme F420-1:gamma-L-glutamate ligase